jgi:hypothetical protein
MAAGIPPWQYLGWVLKLCFESYAMLITFKVDVCACQIHAKLMITLRTMTEHSLRTNMHSF